MELWLYSCLNKHSRLWNFDNFVEYIFAGYSDHSLSINKKNPKSMLYAVITILFSLVSAWSICEVHSRWTLMRHSVWDGIITILLQFILSNEDDSRARWTFDIGLLCFPPINNNNSICYYQIYSLEFLTLSIRLLLANQLIMSHQSSHQEDVTR